MTPWVGGYVTFRIKFEVARNRTQELITMLRTYTIEPFMILEIDSITPHATCKIK